MAVAEEGSSSRPRSRASLVKGPDGIKPIPPTKAGGLPSSHVAVESPAPAVTDLQHTLREVHGGDQE